MEDLYGADEVFITSTNRNVIGVREIAGRPMANEGKGEITQKLDEAFGAFMKDYVGRRLARGQEKRKLRTKNAAERSNAKMPRADRDNRRHRGLQSSTEK